MTVATTEKKYQILDGKKYEVTPILLDDIFLDEDFNCRGNIAPIDVLDLSQDIKNRGLDIPITVQPYNKVPGKKYRIVAGHRRYTAFEVNSVDPDPEVAKRHETIPCFVQENLDEVAAHTMNLRENLHRKQLNIMQEAKALKFYLDLNLNEVDIADIIGLSRGWVQVRKALLQLPPDIQQVAAAGLLTQQQIKQVAGMRSRDKQYEFVKRIKESRERGESLTVTQSIKRSSDALKRRERKGSEIKEMKELIYDVLGPCFTTRFGAWADGTISTVEFNNDIATEAKKQNKTYKTPDWINKALVGDKSE
jgi:ParB/RepB/Spo0J family partition protein